MPYKEVAGTLTDIGTEELAHMEMICAIVYQLTKDLSPEEIERSGFAPYYVDHTLALWPQAASGMPWTATVFQSKGDPITDLHEDLAAEQKARTTYDNILRLVKDPEVCDPIRFLRQREIVHYQRFGEVCVSYRISLTAATSTHSIRSWKFSAAVPSKRKRAAGTRSSVTKNCHSWHLYLPPLMNWRNGNKPPFSSIITYPLPECYTQFLMNT